MGERESRRLFLFFCIPCVIFEDIKVLIRFLIIEFLHAVEGSHIAYIYKICCAKKTIYNIGAEILFSTSFLHNSTPKARTEKLGVFQNPQNETNLSR